jgi:hypothetical protein
MKGLLIPATTLGCLLLLLPVPAFANHDEDQGTLCCKDGSSPWASQSKDAWQPNANAGYQGSDLSPSSGYNSDHLNRFENPQYDPYRQTLQPPPPLPPAYGTSDLRFDPSYGLCGGSTGAACGK